MKKYLVYGALMICVFVAVFLVGKNLVKEPQIEQSNSSVTYFSIGDEKYKIQDGDLYEERGEKFVFSRTLFDADFVERKWRIDNGILYVYANTGERYRVIDDLSEGFENVREGVIGLEDLISPERSWTNVVLQSASAPNPASYSSIKQKILNGGDFLDARVEPISLRAYSGIQSLRTFSPKGSHELGKSSLETGLVHFVKEDHYWYSAWYFVEKGSPITLMDLETSYIEGGPGFRIFLDDNFHPGVELKWADRPAFFAKMTFPRNQWVHVKLHVKLSETQDGLAELWINEEKVLEQNMQTLPFVDLVLDRVEIGLSASSPKTDTEVYVDDVHFSKREI